MEDQGISGSSSPSETAEFTWPRTASTDCAEVLTSWAEQAQFVAPAIRDDENPAGEAHHSANPIELGMGVVVGTDDQNRL